MIKRNSCPGHWYFAIDRSRGLEQNAPLFPGARCCKLKLRPWGLLSSSKSTAQLRKKLHTQKLGWIRPLVKPTVSSVSDDWEPGTVAARLQASV